MKLLFASALMLLAPALALAQTPAKTEPKPAAAKSESKAAAKPAAKPDAKSAKTTEKASPKKAVAKSEPTSSRTQLKSATSQVAAGSWASGRRGSCRTARWPAPGAPRQPPPGQRQTALSCACSSTAPCGSAACSPGCTRAGFLVRVRGLAGGVGLGRGGL